MHFEWVLWVLGVWVAAGLGTAAAAARWFRFVRGARG